MITPSRAPHPTQPSFRARLGLVGAATLACAFLTGPSRAADAAKTSPATPATPDRELVTIAHEEVMTPWTGDLDGMIERRVIRVLTVYSKTFYFVDKGIQRGTTYDMFRLFEADLNKKLVKSKAFKNRHVKMRVVFIPVARGDLLQALVAGKGDIAASNLTINEERLKLVDFSAPAYRNVSEVVVTGPASPQVSSVDDLSGKVVFVRPSSSYHASLMALNGRFAAASKPAVMIKDAPETLEDEDLIEMVNAGLIPLIVVDKHKADFWKKIFPKITVHDSVAVRSGGDIGWVIRKGSPQLKAALDKFVAGHGQGTTSGNSILTRYLKNTKYVRDAGSTSERKKFTALIQYFQKYGDKYDVDWLLMAAQGYQESQLNQAARSPVGAITGVMQVMPATAKDLRVGDITQTEPNIHAGVKYMRWMIDHYYDKEPMTQLDKALFSFASYNCGVGRVAKLRKEAAKRGLDPNVWFDNVEYVAAARIGAETVTYVSNIYKYYIAYRLILEAKGDRDQAIKEMKSQNKGTP
jgi:membrane-bound lytic murein transglycosylase MltF